MGLFTVISSFIRTRESLQKMGKENTNIHIQGNIRISTFMEKVSGERRKAIIIPENVYNGGWGDIAGKILQYLGETANYKYKKIIDVKKRSFLKAAEISQWPTQRRAGDLENQDESSNFLSKCLIGSFNDPFHYSPKAEIIQA
ncbi:hypothetical protein K7X08_036358 [Anisodus acutangulus]|uniref:Uncharacterized protein n=1 Tax=Anisodus acutangulus TaxID=402998 RepID=A0A9Q1L541_9SOLA|nr:hypothetical protein K7X08_036358 [Anisodus acutangulus]